LAACSQTSADSVKGGGTINSAAETHQFIGLPLGFHDVFSTDSFVQHFRMPVHQENAGSFNNIKKE
jgi:hypothetical protein